MKAAFLKAMVLTALVGFVVGVIVGNATAAPLTASCHGSPIASCVARLDVTVKHPQTAVIWTQGCFELGCIGRELYWPVKLHKGRNKFKVGVLGISYVVARPEALQSVRYVMADRTDVVNVGLRRHSPRGQDWVGPIEGNEG